MKRYLNFRLQNSNLNLKICYLLIFIGIILIYVTAAYSEGKFIYDAKKKRDPFIPLVTSDGRIIKLESEADKEEIYLEGIIYEPRSISYAVLSGTVAKIGDVVEGYKVVKIEPSRVILSKEGKTLELELKKEE